MVVQHVPKQILGVHLLLDHIIFEYCKFVWVVSKGRLVHSYVGLSVTY